MILKGLVEEDFLNYKKPCMFLCFPYCTFKCDKENGTNYCHNRYLEKQNQMDISIGKIVSKYIKNDITKAILCAGLEPFDSWDDLYQLIKALREKTDDDIVIYTGYNWDEISHIVYILKQFKNIIIKFGRFIPNQESHFDEVLGVNLASSNQYAERIS